MGLELLLGEVGEVVNAVGQVGARGCVELVDRGQIGGEDLLPLCQVDRASQEQRLGRSHRWSGRRA